MGKRLGRAFGFASLLAVVVGGSACNKNKNTDTVVQGGPPPGMGGPPGMMGGGPGGPRGPIRAAMMKLFKGNPSLKDSISQELESGSPSWEMIQPQTKEFADIVASLIKYDPPKGSKESWTKLMTAFSEQAKTLDHAAAAKNKEDAKNTLEKIGGSCKACHDEHRGGRGGPPGGFRGPGGPPKGPPPQPQ